MSDLQTAVREAQAAIRDDDVSTLRRLIADHPELLHWRDGEQGEVLLQSTTSYANFPGAEQEGHWNRRACAALLIDAGAVVDPRVVLRIIGTGAHEMAAMFEEKGALPHNLRTFAALGDLTRVQACFDAGAVLDIARPAPGLREGYPKAAGDWPHPHDDSLIVADAFLYACRLGHRDVAAFLLARCTGLDPDLAARIDDRESFLDELMDTAPEGARFGYEEGRTDTGPSIVWQAAVTLRLNRALQEADAGALKSLLARESFVLGPDFVQTQEKLLSTAAYAQGALPVIEALLDAGAAIAKADPPPFSRAVSYAIEYGNAAYVRALARVWPLPDDLPHAAGMGDLDAVKRWFDADGKPALGDQANHNPFPAHFPEFSVQDVLDRALAWAVQNGEYTTADWLLDHGADINTRWGTHEPAGILHEVAFAGRMEQVRYLLSKGIDTTSIDDRFESDAAGWARFAGHDDIADVIASWRNDAK